MSRFGSLLTKIQSMLTDYCEFKDICPYFDPEQFTCVNSGGSRCGKYRRFKAEKAAKEHPKPKKQEIR